MLIGVMNVSHMCKHVHRLLHLEIAILSPVYQGAHISGCPVKKGSTVYAYLRQAL